MADLDAAHRAFDRGDFHEARRLARALRRDAADEATRAAADVLLRRTSLDPVIVWISAACVAFFALVLLLKGP
jgi:hypothetical protein